MIGDDEASVLEQRALELARPRAQRAERTLRTSVVLLEVGAAKVGVPRERVREVVHARDPTPLPGLPAWLPGLVAIRGVPVCVVDLSKLLELPSPGGARFLAVVEGRPGLLALLADDLLDLRDVHEDEIAPALGQRRPGSFVKETTHDRIRVLDMDALFGSELVNRTRDAALAGHR